MDTKLSSAIHTLILISEAETPMSSEQIANSVGTNASYIRKLTTRLSKAKIIESRRGVVGFNLKKKPKEITMFDIYKAVMQTDEIHFLMYIKIQMMSVLWDKILNRYLQIYSKKWKKRLRWNYQK